MRTLPVAIISQHERDDGDSLTMIKSHRGTRDGDREQIGNWDLTGRDIASEIFKSTGFRISVRNVEEQQARRKRDSINFRMPNPRPIIPRHVLYDALCNCCSGFAGVCCAAALYDATLFRRQQSVMHKAARIGAMRLAARNMHQMHVTYESVHRF